MSLFEEQAQAMNRNVGTGASAAIQGMFAELEAIRQNGMLGVPYAIARKYFPEAHNRTAQEWQGYVTETMAGFATPMDMVTKPVSQIQYYLGNKGTDYINNYALELQKLTKNGKDKETVYPADTYKTIEMTENEKFKDYYTGDLNKQLQGEKAKSTYYESQVPKAARNLVDPYKAVLSWGNEGTPYADINKFLALGDADIERYSFQFVINEQYPEYAGIITDSYSLQKFAGQNPALYKEISQKVAQTKIYIDSNKNLMNRIKMDVGVDEWGKGFLVGGMLHWADKRKENKKKANLYSDYLYPKYANQADAASFFENNGYVKELSLDEQQELPPEELNAYKQKVGEGKIYRPTRTQKNESGAKTFGKIVSKSYQGFKIGSGQTDRDTIKPDMRIRYKDNGKEFEAKVSSKVFRPAAGQLGISWDDVVSGNITREDYFKIKTQAQGSMPPGKGGLPVIVSQDETDPASVSMPVKPKLVSNPKKGQALFEGEEDTEPVGEIKEPLYKIEKP